MAKYDAQSSAQRALVHPLLGKLLDECIKQRDFRILDSLRGRAEQELAFRRGFSKVHFGSSAHNWVPAVAVDLCPKPIQFKDRRPFISLFREVILPTADRMKIPVRWLGDPDRNPKTNDGWDYPHLELHPWRSYKRKLYQK